MSKIKLEINCFQAFFFLFFSPPLHPQFNFALLEKPPIISDSLQHVLLITAVALLLLFVVFDVFFFF